MNLPERDELLAVVKRMLPGSAGTDPIEIRPLPGGGNNRLFKVEVSGAPFVLKRYFCHPDDRRNRLDSEYRFSQFLWQRGVRCIPEPLARDDDSGSGLYRYVEGTQIVPAAVTDRHLHEAQLFLQQANGWRQDAGALTLPEASEACFTLRQHLDLVERRIQRLLALPLTEGIRGEAALFVRERLLPVWNRVRGRAGETKQSQVVPLATTERILSPSDFGFHNALQTEQGLVFLDFEYAGWDDPAKTVCDFFCQIAVPVPIKYWEKMSAGGASLTSTPESTLLRMQTLLPVYQVKWVCIALNHFLAVDGERRRFAHGDGETQLTSQLDLAVRLLSSIQF